MTPVQKLHQALIDALIQSRPHALDQPVTVAEIYQDLVPYRDVRSDLGFAMNADYEYVLLQLLAGEEDLARIEPIEIREQLRLELDSSNPNVGFFREFAACDVFVTIPDRRYEPAQPVIETVSPPTPPATPADTRSYRTPQRDELPFELPSSQPPPLPRATPSAVRVESSRPPAMGVAASVELAGASNATQCIACEKALPSERKVRFCPFCGHDQTRRTCAGCGELLDDAWRFCIGCGTAALPTAR